MKFERFIATFVMMNIVVLLSIVFTAKNHIIMQSVAEMLHGEKVTSEYFDLPPVELDKGGFEKDSQADIAAISKEVFEKTYISPKKITEISSLPEYERAVETVKLFSLMGDGKCQTDKSLPEKINLAAKKEICAQDAAEIFLLLSEMTGLQTRIVSNGAHFANEFFDGSKWIYIDPYFAMSVSSQESRLSFKEFAERMLNNGWMKFEYFGGDQHCMNGKHLQDHPYFGDKENFAWIMALKGNNVIKMVELENKYGKKPAFIKYNAPYKNGYPAIAYTELADSQKNIISKYVAGLLTLFGIILLGTNILLPAYFIIGLAKRTRKKI